MNIKQVIELVEKWIADPKSVSRKELKAARVDARVLRDTARDGAAYSAANAAAVAANYPMTSQSDTDGAKFWVAEYHKLTKDNV